VERAGAGALECGFGVLAVSRGRVKREVEALVVGATQGLGPEPGGHGFSIARDLHDLIETIPARERAHQKPCGVWLIGSPGEGLTDGLEKGLGSVILARHVAVRWGMADLHG